MAKGIRLDVLVLEHGLAASRERARALILAGQVRVNGQVVSKAGAPTAPDALVELTVPDHPYVGRGGVKLAHALEAFGIDPAGRRALDIGASTGGFTDVLLQRGAKHVVGVDVGHGQLHPRFAADARVTALEGVNARHLEAGQLPFARFDLVVGDLSFISLALVLPALVPLLGGPLLLLVKPQFELQPVDIGPGGKVRHASAYSHVEKKLRKACAANGLAVRDWFDSATPGSEGAREFFLHAVRARDRDTTP